MAKPLVEIIPEAVTRRRSGWLNYIHGALTNGPGNISGTLGAVGG